ncbi:hypothetical protein Dform_01883 [Dehalogenimonas formicexedens]|uniref:Uncharacterized protein n=1 Tax=Dehalogenimonas formicexedens TaxID=1839801 RepID=A0A1P8F9T7_9CHLR|nr:hypothetical protein [Dehalogenimonas formicexedens]APV45200.1 hypothetical protein Dform_01883 [Dehalogenimonas formicexedens]
MNALRIFGLVLIGACVVSILSAVAIGDNIALFIAAIALGILGNILWWLGKPHAALSGIEKPGFYAEETPDSENDESSSSDDKGSAGK